MLWYGMEEHSCKVCVNGYGSIQLFETIYKLSNASKADSPVVHITPQPDTEVSANISSLFIVS